MLTQPMAPHREIPTEPRPVNWLRAYIEVSAITIGRLFRPVDRHGRMESAGSRSTTVALTVKRYAAAVGFDGAKYAGTACARV
jgi:hypothetical protein